MNLSHKQIVSYSPYSVKWFITNYKKQYLYGDCHLEEWGHYYPLIGIRIRVKLFGVLWVTYKEFKKE